MREQRRIHKPYGRLPSGGLPFHLMDGLPLARGDLHNLDHQCRDVYCLDRVEARAGPPCYNTGPPGRRIRLPVTGNLPKVSKGSMRSLGRFTDGSSPPKKRNSHPERSRFLTSEGSDRCGACHPDAVSTAEGSDHCRLYQILRPDKSGLRMTHGLGWSPPGRNGPVGSSPPEIRNRHPDAAISAEGSDRYGNDLAHPSTTLRVALFRWWSPPGRNGPPEAQECNTRKRVTNWMDPLKNRNRHPERSRLLASEGPDQRELYQILRPDKSGLRMTINHGWSPPGRNGPVGTSPPETRNRHPDAGLSTEGSDQRGVIQNWRFMPWCLWRPLRPDPSTALRTSGLRMTACNVVTKQEVENYSADDKQCSVLELCEEEKFSRGKMLRNSFFFSDRQSGR
jgi:hypothetical protein